MEAMSAHLDYFVYRKTFEGWEIPPRYIQNYELVFAVGGRGIVTIEENEFSVGQGDLILFRPGVRHSLRADGEPYLSFYGMHFTFSEKIPFPEIMHPSSSVKLEAIFRRLNEAHLMKGYLHQWREKLLLEEILVEIFTFLREKDEPAALMRVKNALQNIHDTPLCELSPALLMKKSGMGKTEFFRCFRLITGTTPVGYIHNLRLESASELLENTDLPIQTIAETCGFSDPLYFSRRFRERFSVSPREYRKERKTSKGNA